MARRGFGFRGVFERAGTQLIKATRKYLTVLNNWLGGFV
jgi:hypothetical protein